MLNKIVLHIVPACACKKCHLRVIFNNFVCLLCCNLFFGRCRLDIFLLVPLVCEFGCAENFLFVLFNFFWICFKVSVTKVFFYSIFFHNS